jgi:hypothetical protein
MFGDQGFDAWRKKMQSKAAAQAPPPVITYTINCESCGHRHLLARTVEPLEVFHIICHGCELPLCCSWTPQ